jgi:hypothetical protein
VTSYDPMVQYYTVQYVADDDFEECDEFELSQIVLPDKYEDDDSEFHLVEPPLPLPEQQLPEQQYPEQRQAEQQHPQHHQSEEHQTEQRQSGPQCRQHLPTYGIGTQVGKHFGLYDSNDNSMRNVLFIGTVTSYDATVGYYNIRYEDGDEDEVDEAEIKDMIQAVHDNCDCTGRNENPKRRNCHGLSR